MKINLIIGVLVLFAFSQCTSTKESKIANVDQSVFADKIQLTSLEGVSINLTQYRGKTIILNIWATWCKPCIEEMPSLVAMQNKIDPSKYILFLASNESIDKIKKFKSKFSYDLAFIHMDNAPESLGIYSLPTTFIINHKGELMVTETGSKDWDTEASIKEIIEAAEL